MVSGFVVNITGSIERCCSIHMVDTACSLSVAVFRAGNMQHLPVVAALISRGVLS